VQIRKDMGYVGACVVRGEVREGGVKPTTIIKIKGANDKTHEKLKGDKSGSNMRNKKTGTFFF